MSYALGWLLISGDVLWSVLLAYDSEHKLINGVARKMGTTILVSAFLIGFAATTVFPWNAQLGVLNKAIGFLASIQFPWRLLGLTSFLLVVVSCLVVHAVLSMKELLNLIIGVFLLSAYFLRDMRLTAFCKITNHCLNLPSTLTL